MSLVLILHVPEPVLELVVHIEVLLVEVDDCNAGNGGWTCLLKHVCFKEEVDVRAELDAFAVGQGQQFVVVQD